MLIITNTSINYINYTLIKYILESNDVAIILKISIINSNTSIFKSSLFSKLEMHDTIEFPYSFDKFLWFSNNDFLANG